ncbi:MAG: helix-turn-helix transcriptional regulator [Litorimonas sp.]
MQLGFSQTDLGNRIGVTFQQVQKYERGTNRIGASRLWALSEQMDVPVSWFFEGLGTPGSDGAVRPEDNPLEVLGVARDGLEFAKAINAILPGEPRRQLLALARALANAETN